MKKPELRVQWGDVEVRVDVGALPEKPLSAAEMQELSFLVKLAVAKVMAARERWNPLTSEDAAKRAAVPPGKRPETTTQQLKQKWLSQSQLHMPPQDFAEFVAKSMHILHKWYDRWHGLWRLVQPQNFRTPEEKEHFLRENDLKAIGLYHAMRELKLYWREAGVWEGSPYATENLSSGDES